MKGGALIYWNFENLKFGVRLFLKILTQWRGGAFINMDFWESEIWSAFISMKFRSNLPLKYTVNRKNFRLRRAETMKRGVRLFLKFLAQWRGGALIYLRFENLKFGVRLFWKWKQGVYFSQEIVGCPSSQNIWNIPNTTFGQSQWYWFLGYLQSKTKVWSKNQILMQTTKFSLFFLARLRTLVPGPKSAQ